jgi:hypothetical protein
MKKVWMARSALGSAARSSSPPVRSPWATIISAIIAGDVTNACRRALRWLNFVLGIICRESKKIAEQAVYRGLLNENICRIP